MLSDNITPETQKRCNLYPNVGWKLQRFLQMNKIKNLLPSYCYGLLLQTISNSLNNLRQHRTKTALLVSAFA